MLTMLHRDELQDVQFSLTQVMHSIFVLTLLTIFSLCFYRLFTTRNPHSPLRIIREQGFLAVNGLIRQALLWLGAMF